MASDDLRARLAEALWGAPVHATVMRLDVVTDVYGPADALTDAVMAIVQPELDRLTAELHRHADCALCGHERHRHGYEPIIRRDWCSECPTASDLHTFQPKETER